MACFLMAGHTPALEYAAENLKQHYPFLDHPDSQVTHLLLPVPSLDSSGNLKGGGNLQAVLNQLSPNVVIVGGNLPQWLAESYRVLDILKDPVYQAANANITAHCAVKQILNVFPSILSDAAVLILGWGRIGKCLSQLLRNMGADVTIFARKASDRAMAEGLGFRSCTLDSADFSGYPIIVNTVPAMILPCPPADAIKIDLASVPGVGGDDVIWARFLPGKDAPASSGKLIAKTIISHMKEEIS